VEDAKKRRVKIWLDRSQYDWDTARAMLEARRYIYVAFMCQQAIEKRLKAYIEDRGTTPPPVHNLVNLSKMADVYDSMPEEIKDFLQELTAYYLDSRYKEDLAKLTAFMSRERSEVYLQRAEEVLKWLIQEKKF